MAKAIGAPYAQGRRSKLWRKIKVRGLGHVSAVTLRQSGTCLRLAAVESQSQASAKT